jgi:hypothetical protein
MAEPNWYNVNRNRGFPFLRGSTGRPADGPLSVGQLPYLLGQASGGVSLASLAEAGWYLPLEVPWLLVRNGGTLATAVSTSALAGNCTVSLCIGGLNLAGFLAGR